MQIGTRPGNSTSAPRPGFGSKPQNPHAQVINRAKKYEDSKLEIEKSRAKAAVSVNQLAQRKRDQEKNNVCGSRYSGPIRKIL